MKKYIGTKKRLIVCIAAVLLCVSLSTGCADTQPVEAVPPGPISNAVDTARDTPDSGIVPASVTKEVVDWSTTFQGLNGCAVIYDPQNRQYLFYNKDLCETRVSPLSTFKVVSALLGLHFGVLTDEKSVMHYTGVQYPVAEWNRELSLLDAFQTSCIWYFRQNVDLMGQDTVQHALESLHYGNMDISAWDGGKINPMQDLNGFWLNASLTISPMEQTQVLAAIFEEGSQYDGREISVLKSIMRAERDDGRAVYAKTGSANNGRAWYIGFIEEDTGRYYFAVYLDAPERNEEVSGDKAKEIALAILRQVNT